MPSIDFKLVGIVASWFICSVVTEVYDKTIMMQLAAPLSLALWKFVVSVPCGVISVVVSGSGLSLGEKYCQPGVLQAVMPLAALIVAAKLLTYISYGHVPLSTAQIVKAATPIVTVLMTRSILGEKFGVQSYLSLIPIACGVCLSVGLDVDFNLLGIMAALASCAFAAAQAIYMKSLFLLDDASITFDALSLNLLSASCCATLLLPIWLGVQIGVVPAALDGGKLYANSAATFAGNGSRMWFAFIIGAVTQYAQSVCAYLFLERVSPATSSVVGTARKPFIVVVSVVVFARPITTINLCGIVMAFGGVFWYNYARHVEVQATKQQYLLSPSDRHDGGEGSPGEAPAARCLKAFADWYEEHLARSPLLVKAVTSALLYGAGDLIAQAAVTSHAGPSHPHYRGGGGGGGGDYARFDGARLARAVAYGGIFYPPLAHAHFNFLEYLVVARWRLDASAVPWAKMAIEQFIYWSYFSNAYYHVVIGALQGFTPLACLHRLSLTLWPTMKAQWALWVPAQVINFKYVPLRHQLNFVLVLSLAWTTFLSLAFPPEVTREANVAIADGPRANGSMHSSSMHLEGMHHGSGMRSGGGKHSRRQYRLGTGPLTGRRASARQLLLASQPKLPPHGRWSRQHGDGTGRLGVYFHTPEAVISERGGVPDIDSSGVMGSLFYSVWHDVSLYPAVHSAPPPSRAGGKGVRGRGERGKRAGGEAAAGSEGAGKEGAGSEGTSSVPLLVNMVVEVPRGSTAKYEVQTRLAGNPIMQDMGKGQVLRHHTYGVPFFNYGMLPRTWADPKQKRLAALGLVGDNDPLDVIEIGGRPLMLGGVRAVKVLGSLELVDQGESDEKILVIDVEDPQAAKLSSAADLATAMPGVLENLIDWLKNYKTKDGKPPNVLRSESPTSPEAAARAIAECHQSWQELRARGSSSSSGIGSWDASSGGTGFWLGERADSSRNIAPKDDGQGYG